MSNPISNEVALVNDCIRSLLRIHCVCYQGTLLKRSGRHCGSEKNYRLQDIQLSKSRQRSRFTRFPVLTSKNLVENTGLEPVTSWLQTRRSPS